LRTSKIRTEHFLFIIILTTIVLSSCGVKRRLPISYELPKGYTGWVTVKYEKPDAPPLERIGKRFIIKISNNGFAETSSRLEEGWAEDEYFWLDGGEKVILQQYTEDKKSRIFGESFSNVSYDKFVNPDTLQIGKEVTLYDGGKVTKLDDKGGISFKSGRYLLYKFYVSDKLEDIWDFGNSLPPVPKEHEEW
jgi:Family of unknown function (DUF6843)